MKCYVSKAAAQTLQKLGKGIEFHQIHPLQSIKSIHKPLVLMCIPALAAHLSEVSFTCSDNKNCEFCKQTGHLIDFSGIGSGMVSDISLWSGKTGKTNKTHT